MNKHRGYKKTLGAILTDAEEAYLNTLDEDRIGATKVFNPRTHQSTDYKTIPESYQKQLRYRLKNKFNQARRYVKDYLMVVKKQESPVVISVSAIRTINRVLGEISHDIGEFMEFPPMVELCQERIKLAKKSLDNLGSLFIDLLDPAHPEWFKREGED